MRPPAARAVRDASSTGALAQLVEHLTFNQVVTASGETFTQRRCQCEYFGLSARQGSLGGCGCECQDHQRAAVRAARFGERVRTLPVIGCDVSSLILT